MLTACNDVAKATLRHWVGKFKSSVLQMLKQVKLSSRKEKRKENLSCSGSCKGAEEEDQVLGNSGSTGVTAGQVGVARTEMTGELVYVMGTEQMENVKLELGSQGCIPSYPLI